MATMKEKILLAIKTNPGLTDREITNLLIGEHAGQQAVNQAARGLAEDGMIDRRKRHDGKIGNYPAEEGDVLNAVGIRKPVRPVGREELLTMTEDEVKQRLKDWLEADDWEVSIKWGHERGIDIEAKRGEENWVIEVKGSGSRNEMRNNYFLGVLGETLQRMSDQETRYSVAFPDLEKFRRLWAELPFLVKKKILISALFVGLDGVEQVF